jgi:F0F1-type ATP synthase membrane subunit b/b'
MQNLLKQIVEMDQKAREITDSAQLEKANSEKEVEKLKEELRRNYLEKARQRIAKSEPLERAAAEKEWNEKNSKNDALLKKINDLYTANFDRWVDEITKRIIGGIS